jgi:hypothetical protein
MLRRIILLVVLAAVVATVAPPAQAINIDSEPPAVARNWVTLWNWFNSLFKSTPSTGSPDGADGELLCSGCTIAPPDGHEPITTSGSATDSDGIPPGSDGGSATDPDG